MCGGPGISVYISSPLASTVGLGLRYETQVDGFPQQAFLPTEHPTSPKGLSRDAVAGRRPGRQAAPLALIHTVTLS